MTDVAWWAQQARGDRIRVAMVYGPGRADRDGVGDYVERLMEALGEAGVETVPVPVGSGGAGSLRRPSDPCPSDPCPSNSHPSIPHPSDSRRSASHRSASHRSAWRRSAWHRAAAVAEAAREVRRLRPDVIHVQFSPSAYRFSGLPGLLPPLLPAGVPLVTTLHEYGWWAAPSWVPGAVWRRLERARLWDRETGRLVPASAMVVVTNPSHAREVRRRAGTAAVEVPLAPNVVDHGGGARARERVRAELGMRPDDPLLAFFGFVHPVKGVRYLIEAVAALRAARPGLRLLVLGGFTSQALPEDEARAFRAELEGLAAEHGVADAVTFTGHLPADRVSEALHAADAGVLPFTAGVTTKSGALLTMLAHGLPTAVTIPDEPDPALPPGEAVVPIAARRDASAVAAAVTRLLDDADLRRRLPEAARRLVARHSWPRVAAAHRALYETLTGSRRALGSRHA